MRKGLEGRKRGASTMKQQPNHDEKITVLYDKEERRLIRPKKQTDINYHESVYQNVMEILLKNIKP